VASDWDRALINLSACPPLSLEPHTWWFPIVGRVPYLGFFREQDAARWQRRLEADGYEVWTRPVGAYSTLGWFRDPVLPGMLDWPEHLLAEVILHETAHATLWVPGEVGFNETWAVVVGEEASRRWMLAEHGEGSEAFLRMEDERHDDALWRALLESVYQDLDGLYKDLNTTPETKLREKAARFARMEVDIQRMDLRDPARLRRMLREEDWNNARIMQAHAYDDRRALIEALLARHGGDIRTFTEDLRERIAAGHDPWAALAASLEPTSGSYDKGVKNGLAGADRPGAPGHEERSADRDTGP
jgi:predicted aminopeptidase